MWRFVENAYLLAQRFRILKIVLHKSCEWLTKINRNDVHHGKYYDQKDPNGFSEVSLSIASICETSNICGRPELLQWKTSRILRQLTGNMTLIYFKRYSKHVYKPVSHAGHTEENALYQWAGNSQYPGTVCIAVQREDHTWLMGIISWDDGPFYIWSVFPISHIDFRN